MTDLISKDKVLDILKNLGGCDAQDEYSKGWDDAVDMVDNDVGNLPNVESFTKEELCMLSFGLGVASAFIELKSINFNSIMEKINRMTEVQ